MIKLSYQSSKLSYIDQEALVCRQGKWCSFFTSISKVLIQALEYPTSQAVKV